MVVPSLGGDVGALLASLGHQTLRADEVVVVQGVRPSGRARNLGAARTSADVVVFVDDDARLGGDALLANLVAPLVGDPGIGVTGTAKLLPPDASRFQRLVARQVPRVEHAVVTELTDTNPPVGRHGYTDVTTTCCAVRRSVLQEVDGFHEGLERGEDTELFHRIRRLGHRLVLVPGTWVHHPAPPNLPALLAKTFRYGIGYSQEVRLDPSRAAGRYLRTPLHAAAYLLVRTLGLVPHTFVPWSYSAPSWSPGFKPLGALAGYTAACGYVYGWYRYPIDRQRRGSTT